MPDDDQLPCERTEVLRVCLNALRICPHALTKPQRELIRRCVVESNWHKSADYRKRMRKLYSLITS